MEITRPQETQKKLETLVSFLTPGKSWDEQWGGLLDGSCPQSISIKGENDDMTT